MASFLKGLSDIAGDYDAILCDVWGVIHNGRESFGDACIALKKFRETRGVMTIRIEPGIMDELLQISLDMLDGHDMPARE